LVGVSSDASYVKMGGLQGHLARAHASDHVGILDAGIPHYEHGGVVAGGSTEKDAEVRAWSRKIGIVASSGDSFVRFRASQSFRPRVDHVSIRGISNHVYTSAQTVRGLTPVYLVPEKIGQFEGKYDEGDVFVLSV
ncbi:MAG: hypothetical protein ACFFC0_02040, partial [Promethearchaeota archaeon]